MKLNKRILVVFLILAVIVATIEAGGRISREIGGTTTLPTDWRYTGLYLAPGIADTKSITTDTYVTVSEIDNQYQIEDHPGVFDYYFQIPVTISISNKTGSPKSGIKARVSIVDANDNTVLYDVIRTTDKYGFAKFGYSIRYSGVGHLQSKCNTCSPLPLYLFVTTDKTRYVKEFTIYLD